MAGRGRSMAGIVITGLVCLLAIITVCFALASR
jgi:hypothetical protein